MQGTVMNRIVVVALAAGLSGPTVDAQSTRPSPPSDEAPSADRGVLAGPKVPQGAKDQFDPGFGGSDRPRQQFRIPPREWFELLRQCDLSEQQQGEVAAIVGPMQEARRNYQRRYGEQIRTLRRQLREARTAGEEPADELRRELTRLTSLGPKTADYQQRIWLLLNEGQQQQMRTGLEAIRKRMAERRAAEREAAMDQPQRDTAPRGEASRRRSDPALDEMGRRRLDFLRSRQVRRQRDARPAQDERRRRRDRITDRPGRPDADRDGPDA